MNCCSLRAGNITDTLGASRASAPRMTGEQRNDSTIERSRNAHAPATAAMSAAPR